MTEPISPRDRIDAVAHRLRAAVAHLARECTVAERAP